MVSALRNTSGMITALPRLSTTPPSSMSVERRGEPAEVAVARVADRRAVRGRVLMDDLRAERGVHRDGHAEAKRVEQHRELRIRELRARVERAAERFAHALRVLHPAHEGVVHLAPRLLGHAERSVAQTRGDVFGRGAEARDLVIVDRRRSRSSRRA